MSGSPQERTLDTDVFGRQVTFKYSETWVGYSLLSLRIVMAWVFLQAGLEKLSADGWSNITAWSSEFYLLEVISEDNPLKDLFVWMADFTAILDPLVMFGQILIGLALFFGIAVRFAALMGGLQMLFFWTAAWQAGIAQGLPVAHGYFVDSSFVYLLLLFGLGAWGAGRIVGVDAKLEESAFVERRPWLRYVLG